METTANVYCRQIVEVLAAHGVRTAYCSPGSRNAPLLIALDSKDEIEKMVIVDERSAAFQALGCSLIERCPVAVVCTSGTAVLNYAPAVAEAYYSGVPLIVISADRPREWIDQDDSQTIRQFQVLDHIVKGSYDIRAIPEGSDREYTEEVRWMVNRTVNEAMLKSLEGKPGPVHINVQLSDPLGKMEDIGVAKERKVSLMSTYACFQREAITEFARIASGMRIMLVAGFMQPDHKLDRAVRSMGALDNVAVFAETLANLHDPQPMSTMVDAVLCDMSDEEKESMRPDLVISIGGALVSRMLKQYLREYPPQLHWSIGHSNYFCDCFKSLTDIFDVAPASFLSQLSGVMRRKIKIVSDYSSRWLGLRKRSALATQKYVEAAPWSDMKAFQCIFDSLSLDNLFVSNGTAIRYSQLFPHECHAEYCNRGVSGIDGSTSTAVGAAWSYTGKTTLLTGDMSWIYDSGASALGAVPHDMRIVVMDNSGGGIFRFIKSTSTIPDDILDRYFCVPELPDIESIALAYGLEVSEASGLDSLRDGLVWLSEDSYFARMLIVRTPAEESASVLGSYFTKRLSRSE